MAASPGRSTDARSVSGVGTTSGSAAITAPAGSFDVKGDVGRTITGTGIPGGATLSAVASATAATLSANATATGTVTVTLGVASPAALGFSGWSPLHHSEQGAYTVSAVNAGTVAVDKIPDINTRVDQRSR